MNVPIEFVAVLLTALIAMQGWALVQLVDLKAEVAALKAELAAREIILSVQTQTKKHHE
jgi:hypothetical protein